MAQTSFGLQRLAVFTAVADSGGFTAAANRLGVSKAVVSQQIRRLEAELGAALFTRTTRKVALTDAGRRLYASSTPLVRELNAVLQGIAAESAALTGTLRLTASADYVNNVLSAHLVAFSAQHPSLRIEVLASDEIVDLVGERIDLAFRMGWLRVSSLKATRFSEFEEQVIAAPSYLAGRRIPRTPAELADHAWIALTRLRSPLTYEFRDETAQRVSVRMQSRLRCNSPVGVLALTRQGGGIAALADFMVAPDIASGRLVRLLPRWSLPKGGIYGVYPSATRPPPQARALIDFIRGRSCASGSIKRTASE